MNRLHERLLIAAVIALFVGGGGFVVSKVFDNSESNAVQDQRDLEHERRMDRQDHAIDQFRLEYRDDQNANRQRLEEILSRLPRS